MKISRRVFLLKVNLGLLCSTFIGKVSGEATYNSKLFIQKIKGRSIIFPNKTYSHLEDFWKDHPERESGIVNKLFRKRGLLIDSHFYLDSDGQSVVLKKTFYNEKACDLYNKMLEKNFPDRKKTVIYSKIS